MGSCSNSSFKNGETAVVVTSALRVLGKELHASLSAMDEVVAHAEVLKASKSPLVKGARIAVRKRHVSTMDDDMDLFALDCVFSLGEHCTPARR